MIYVLTSIGYDEQFNIIQLIKIGYAKNFKNRLATYKLHNPLIKVLFKIEKGTKILEYKLHQYFGNHKYEEYGNEWFYYNDEILEFFRNNRTIKSIENRLSNIPDNPINKFNTRRKLNSILGLYIGYNWNYDLHNYYKSEEDLYNELIHSKNRIDSIEDFKDYIIRRHSNIRLRELSTIYSEKDSERLKSEMHQFYEQYGNIKNNTQLVLKLYCELDISEETKDRIYDLLPNKIKSYLSLGSKKLKSVLYIPEKIDNLLINKTINIDDVIYSKYQSGDKLVKSDLKKDLQDIYDKSGLSKKAKATDIEEWFNTSNGQKTINGKRVNLIILVDKKK